VDLLCWYLYYFLLFGRSLHGESWPIVLTFIIIVVLLVTFVPHLVSLYIIFEIILLRIFSVDFSSTHPTSLSFGWTANHLFSVDSSLAFFAWNNLAKIFVLESILAKNGQIDAARLIVWIWQAMRVHVWCPFQSEQPRFFVHFSDEPIVTSLRLEFFWFISKVSVAWSPCLRVTFWALDLSLDRRISQQ